jgi:type I restriction enzyme R subunit
VKVATNPFADTNFQWFNEGLINQAEDDTEYPVEYLYKKALSKEQVLEYISFYLIYVPAEDKIDETGVRVVKDAVTIFPRYPQPLLLSETIGGEVHSFHESRTLKHWNNCIESFCPGTYLPKAKYHSTRSW